MVKKREPLTNEEGDVRELTADDFAWFMRNSDFADLAATTAFLEARERLLSQAEAEGFDRDLFLAFAPNKPGFEDRARRAIAAFKNSALHAAE
jgi:hypothetical protein